MRKIAVLMSTYNGGKHIKTQLDTILAQADCEVSLLVRDDGSTDNTTEILREYESAGKLRWYRGENLKPAKSFMDLVFHSPEADYYAFADQDDIWDKDKLSWAENHLREEKGPAFYHSNARLADADGKATGVLLHTRNPRLNFFSVACAGGVLGCTMVFNRSLRDVIIQASEPEKIRMHDYYIAMLCLGIGGNGIYDNVPHINYRQHGSNVLGVAVGFTGKLKSKVKQFLKKEPFSIAEQAQEVLKHYGESFLPEYKKQCMSVTKYKDSLLRTLRTAMSTRAHYSSVKNSMFIRFCILMRRR